MARLAPNPAASLPDADQDVLIFEDADELMSRTSSASMEDVQAKVKEAQEELLQLRLRQEEIERQKQHLELIRQKQERFTRGKRELMEKLSHALVGIEGELYNTQKLTEELNATYDNFTRHVEVLRGLQPEKWQRAHVDEELDRAIASIQEADGDFLKAERRLATVRPASDSPTLPELRSAGDSGWLTANDDFMTWVRRGLGFTLPLMGLILFALVLAKLMF